MSISVYIGTVEIHKMCQLNKNGQIKRSDSIGARVNRGTDMEKVVTFNWIVYRLNNTRKGEASLSTFLTTACLKETGRGASYK